MPAKRGTFTEAVRSGIPDRVIVLIPAFSISLCTWPTDQQQTGQTGTKITMSIPSPFMCSIMAGVLSSNNSFGCRIYPI